MSKHIKKVILMKILIINLLIIVSFLGLFLTINYLTRNSDEKFIIRDIKLEFEGVVTEKIAKRKNLYLDIKIKRENKSDTIIEASDFISEINIGDTIIKKSNSPYFYRINKIGVKKIPFIYIPEKMVTSKKISDSWKDSLNTNWKPLVKKMNP